MHKEYDTTLNSQKMKALYDGVYIPNAKVTKGD